MSGSALQKAIGCLFSLAGGFFILKVGLDVLHGMLNLMSLKVPPLSVGMFIVGVAIAMLTLGAYTLAALLFTPFATHTVQQTWDNMSPLLRDKASAAAQLKLGEVRVEGDQAFEVLRISSLRRERNIALIRDERGTKMRMSYDFLAYALKQ